MSYKEGKDGSGNPNEHSDFGPTYPTAERAGVEQQMPAVARSGFFPNWSQFPPVSLHSFW